MAKTFLPSRSILLAVQAFLPVPACLSITMRKRFLASLALLSLFAARGGAAVEGSRRSLEHPIARAAAEDSPAFPGAPRMQVYHPWGASVYRDEKWEVYSAGANQLTCQATDGDRTWVGTQLGLKRIDRRARTVRHYTRLEGLPGDSVEAVCAKGPEVWCSILTSEPFRTVSNLCRLDRNTDRWVTVREVRIPASYPTGGFPTGGNLQPWAAPVLAFVPGGICFFPGNRAARDGSRDAAPDSAALYVYRQRSGSWEDIPWDPEDRRRHPRPVLYAAEIDDEAAWIGSESGLLRYEWRRRRWTELGGVRPVFALRRSGGNVWAVLADCDSGPEPIPIGHGWRLARLTERGRTWEEYPTARLHVTPGQATAEFGTPLALEVTGKAAWVVLSSGGAGPIPRPIEMELRTRRWYAPARRGELVVDMDLVPDSVFLRTVAPFRENLVAEFPNRFPGFVCPRENLPPAALSDPASAPPVTDAAGATWSTDGFYLLRKLPDQLQEQFRPEPADLLLNPWVYRLEVVDDRPVTYSPAGIHTLDPVKGWRPWKLPLPDLEQNPFSLSLAGDRDGLWLAIGATVMRYDPRAELLRVLLTPADQSLTLFAITERDYWFLKGNRLLYRCRRGSQDAIPVTPVLPPALKTDEGPNQLTPRAVAGGMVWYSGALRDGARLQPVIVGWDPDSDTWTDPHYGESWTANDDAIREFGGTVYVAGCHGSNVPVVGYDLRDHKWSAASPSFPTADPTYLTMIAVSPERLWCLDQRGLAVWELDRKRSVWARYPYPGGKQVYTGHVAALAGRTIYVGTQEGVWELDLATHHWDRHPFHSNRGLTLEAPVVGGESIWCLGHGTRTYALRFTPATRGWRIWDLKGDWPDTGAPRPLLADSDSVWVLLDGTAYRLDPASGRWIDPIVEGAGAHPYVRQMAADGAQVWLLTSGTTLVPPSPGGDLLLSYDVATGRVTRYGPAGHPLGSRMLVEPGAIWVAASDIFCRFDRRTHVWDAINVPLSGDLQYSSVTISRLGNDLWLGVNDRTIRWKGAFSLALHSQPASDGQAPP